MKLNIEKIKRVVTFGDSWPDGCELKPGEITYGRILANKLNCEFINMAQGATSIDHMVVQSKTYIQNNTDHTETLAVFFLTSYLRFLYFENNRPSGGVPRDDSPVSVAWYKYIHSEELAQHRANTCILALQNMCQQVGIIDRYICGWTRPDLSYPGIDSSKIHPELAINWINVDADDLSLGRQGKSIRSNPYMMPNVDHPNQAGHHKIADVLYSWIF